MSVDSGSLFPDLEQYEEFTDMTILDSPILVDDATLESNMRFQPATIQDVPLQPPPPLGPPPPLVAPPPLGPPNRSPIHPNPHNFKVEISSTDINRKKYLYSSQLNKIYVDMLCDFAVQFSWQHMMTSPVFVRATVVFTDKEQAEKRVERCVQHRHENNANLPEQICMNVLRSSREVGTSGVRYDGEVSRPDSWYSVLVEVPSSPAQHAYRFVCKNSCSSGINRRAISIIFTLEDAFGNVYGREITDARVCACPRRDLLKDEESIGVFKPGKKRVAANQLQAPKGKKVKIEVVPTSPAVLDDNVLMLPPLQVVGANVLTTGLEMMVRMMEQGISARSEDPQYVANCNSCIAGLKAHIAQYKNNTQ